MWVDPPDESGDEVLHVVSERRSFTLKGHSFREFQSHVLPLLDGTRTIDEIVLATSDHFRAEDLVESLNVLAEHGIVVDGASAIEDPVPDGDVATRMAPQINLFHELGVGMAAQHRLQAASAAVLGLGGAGAQTALALGAAGLRFVRCVDWLPVTASDVYFSPFLGTDRIGVGRARAVADAVGAAAPEVEVAAIDEPLESESDLRSVVEGIDVVVCCLDPAQTNLIYKLNRVCLERRLPWIASALAGAEVVVGPTIEPGRGPCYLCYRMRAIACAGNPELEFAHERQLDRARRDDSARRENLTFSAGLTANLVGLEVIKLVTGITEPSLLGQILTIRLTDLTFERHTILRKPWCPACGSTESPGDA